MKRNNLNLLRSTTLLRLAPVVTGLSVTLGYECWSFLLTFSAFCNYFSSFLGILSGGSILAGSYPNVKRPFIAVGILAMQGLDQGRT